MSTAALLQDLTLADKLVLAACAVGHESVLTAELVLAAWRGWRDDFGLPGHEQVSADSNKVISQLCHKSGPVRKGFLHRIGPNLYALTPRGLQHAAALRGDAPARPAAAGTRLPAGDDHELQAMLDSDASFMFSEGGKAGITFAHACRFWTVTQSGSAARLNAVAALLRRCNEAAAPLLLRSGREVEAGEVRCMQHLDGFLREKFCAHLRVLADREKGEG